MSHGLIFSVSPLSQLHHTITQNCQYYAIYYYSPPPPPPPKKDVKDVQHHAKLSIDSFRQPSFKPYLVFKFDVEVYLVEVRIEVQSN